MRAPANGTRLTSFSSPGSKRTAVPAGIFRRRPRAAARSKCRARLTSKKWKWLPTWTGRSPVCLTSSVVTGRPALAWISSASSKYSPGRMLSLLSLADRIVDRHELGAIGEGCLDLHLVDHLRDALQDVGAGKDRRAEGHDLGHAFAIAGRLHKIGR